MTQLLNLNTQSNSMSRARHFLFCAGLIASALSLNGCVSNPAFGNPSAKNSVVEARPHELTAEFVYKYLVAEFAGQSGDLATSGSIFYDLALAERDPRLAERAAKTAAYGNVKGLAMPAVKLWAELDPTSNEAQQAMTEMLISSGKLSDTEPYLAKLLQKEETRASGFLYVNALLNRSPDKNAVLNLIQSLAKPYPNLPEAQFAIAQSAWAAKQDELALQALNQAETLKPGWGPAALLKGQVLFVKSPEAAIAFYQDFVKQHPEANEIRLNLAKLLVSQKQYATAKKEYPVILGYAKTSPQKNIPEVTAIIGLLSYQSADYLAADIYFKQALELGFKDADQIYIYQAQTAEKLNQNEAAIAYYNKVKPGLHYLEAQLNLANWIARKQSVDKAIETLDALENLSTEQQIIVIQAQASMLSKAKRDQDSFDLLDKAVKNMPNTPELVYDYALAAERVKKFDVMESELRKAIAAKPDFAASYNALGYSFADRNIRLDEAITLIEKGLSLSPNDHFMLDSLGWAHYRKGSLDKAIDYLQQAYKASQDPEIAAHLGEVLWQKGQHEAAKKIWSEALSADPNNEVLLAITNKFKS